jgi:predicted nucleic acid-binding protein
LTYLIDTNVLSEVRKGQRCDRNVAAWYRSVAQIDLYLSVIVTGELRRGIELLRHRDPVQAGNLQNWLQTVDTQFGDRILPVDRLVADEWGRLAAIRTIAVADGLQAATARVHGMIFATRNQRDVAGLGVQLLDPFEFGAEQG